MPGTRPYNEGYVWNEPLSSGPRVDQLFWPDLLGQQALLREERTKRRTVKSSSSLAPARCAVSRQEGTNERMTTGGVDDDAGRKRVVGDEVHVQRDQIGNRDQFAFGRSRLSNRQRDIFNAIRTQDELAGYEDSTTGRLGSDSHLQDLQSPGKKERPQTFTNTLRSLGYRPREHEGSLTVEPSLRCLSPLLSDSTTCPRHISQWIAKVPVSRTSSPIRPMSPCWVSRPSTPIV